MEIAGMVALALALGGPAQEVAEPQDSVARLRGSPAAMEEQHAVALEQRLPFFESREEIEAAVGEGALVELPGDRSYEVADFVDLPYAIAPARTFVEWTAERYLEACGEPLVVTSGVRAQDEQPPNAHDLSVHPAGMAVDLRVSQNEACRDWLEEELLAMEARGLLNGTREFNPPHYHIAVYPARYTAYVARQRAAERPPTAATEPGAVGRGLSIGLVLALVAAAGVAALLLLLASRRDPGEGSEPGE